MVNSQTLQKFTNDFWDKEILPTLTEYITIPNKSVSFDPDWESHGHVDKAFNLVKTWLENHKIPGSRIHTGRLPKLTPLFLIEIPGELPGTILMYGHLDKQPEMEGWREGLGPWTPVREGDKLYGRGGADDGYAVFACVGAIKAVREQGFKHKRLVILIEFSEESGSPDLPAYLEKFGDIMGNPELVICMDSGGGNYDQFWLTTSLRGLVTANLRVDVLKEGVHSGQGSGIYPSSFRVARELFSRIENEKTGKLPRFFYVDVPEKRKQQAKEAAQVLNTSVYKDLPALPGVKPITLDPVDLLLSNCWSPSLCYTGVSGMPSCKDAGNVLRAYTEFKLSFRLPPTADGAKIKNELHKLLTEDPPYGAKITAHFEHSNGWNSPELDRATESLVQEVSKTYYGKPAIAAGLGGSIPFMTMLGQKFPKVQFIITGVLGPGSNAHGPNEFLHISYAKKLTACIAHIVGKFGNQH